MAESQMGQVGASPAGAGGAAGTGGGGQPAPARRSWTPSSTPAEDLALVRAVLRDEPWAVEAFVARMHCIRGMVAGLDRRTGRLLDEHELADLVQDALVVVWRKLAHYAAEASLEFWVYRICYFELMNGIRRKARRPRPSGDVPPEAGERAEAAPSEPPYGRERVHAGLAELGPPAADVIRLKHFEGLTFAEIGGRLGISPNTAKARHYRGLDKLEEILRRGSGGEGGGGRVDP